MLITKFSFQNLYSFENFTVDLTYPRPLKFTTIDHEYLSFAPKFKVKRVCVISGGNATGKTSVGKLLCAAMNFIAGRNNAMPYIKMRKPNDKATIVIEFVIPKAKTLHEAILTFQASENESEAELVKIEHRGTQIRKNDTQITARKRLMGLEFAIESLKDFPEIDLAKSLHKKVWLPEQELSNNLAWKYIFYETSESSDKGLARLKLFDLNIASKILKAFDPTIQEIKELVERREKQGKNSESPKPQAYQIEFNNSNRVTLDSGNLSNSESYKRLSKGTFEALSIIDFIESIIQFKESSVSATLFLDERMAHVHTQLEMAMLNVMIQKLGNTSQLFYTTHNTDLLEMEVPIHSHLFLKRNTNALVEAVQPEVIFKKNDRKLSQYVKNDIFGTCPDTSLIDEIVYAEE